MTRKIGAGLYQNYNAWYVRKVIPKQSRVYFGNKRYLFKNLETTYQGVAVGRAEPIMQEWKDLIRTARRKHNGEVVDFQEAVKVAEAKMASFNDPWRGIAAVGHDLQINLGSMDPAERAEKLFVLGQAAGKATPILKYLNEWLSETKYTAAGATECRNYFEKRFPNSLNIGRQQVLMN